jgi:hypothetical protein
MAGLVAAALIGGTAPARADVDTFMTGFMITSGVVLIGIGTVGLVDLYGRAPPTTEEERRRRYEAEPFMWMGIAAGAVCLGLTALVLADDDEAPPEGEEGAAEGEVSLSVAPVLGPSWGAAAALRW